MGGNPKNVEQPQQDQGCKVVPMPPAPKTPQPETPAPKESAASQIKIIDVSHWEPKIDYGAVANAGYGGVVAKCTEGTGYFDASFLYHEGAAKEAGLPFGTYHFLRYNVTGESQANFYVEKAKGSSGLFIADVEWADQKQELGENGANTLLAFLETVERLTGKVAWIYTNPNFFTGFGHPERFAKYPLWNSQFISHPKIAAPWRQALAWQFQYDPQQSGPVEVVPGAGKIDVSWFYGSEDTFRAICRA